MTSLLVVYAGLLAFAPLFALAQRLRPERAVDAVFTRARAADWLWWLFSPTVTGAVTRAATIGFVGSVGVLLGHGKDLHAFAGALARLSFIPQLLLALVVADAAGYLSHRLRHTHVGWTVHAVHHASERVDWLAAARMHPLDDAFDNVFVGATLVFCGFSLDVFEMLGPILILHTLFTHANLDVDLGPLRFVFVSPKMHRWHHARDRHVNYAGMFAFFDVACGTFHVPTEKPESFGADVPHGFLAQLAHPFVVSFRRAKR